MSDSVLSPNLPTPRSPWIAGPLFDIFFMFGGLIFALGWLVFDFFSPLDYVGQHAAKIVSIFFLSGGHLFAPFLLMALSSRERARARMINPRFDIHLWSLLFVPVALYGGAAIIFSTQYQTTKPSIIDIRPLIALMGFFWFTWNSWHFGMQNFGVMQIYRSKSGITSHISRKFDLIISIYAGVILPVVLAANASVAIDFFTVFWGPVTFLRPFIPPMMIGAGILAIAAVIRIILDDTKSIPLAMAYFSIFAQVFLIWHLPILFITLAQATTHWFQEIFLISQIYADEKVKKTSSYRHYKIFAAILAVLMLIGGPLYFLIFRIDTVRTFKISVSGMMKGLDKITPEIFWLVATIFSILMFFSLGHFYLDRIIYKGRRW